MEVWENADKPRKISATGIRRDSVVDKRRNSSVLIDLPTRKCSKTGSIAMHTAAEAAAASFYKPPRWLVDHILNHGVKHIRATFNTADAASETRDGFLDRGKFYHFLRSYGTESSPTNFTELQLRRMYQSASRNQTRQLRFETILEWLEHAQHHHRSSDPEEEEEEEQAELTKPSRLTDSNFRRARALLDIRNDQRFVKLKPLLLSGSAFQRNESAPCAPRCLGK